MALSATPICERLGVRYPIFGFSHSVEVVAEIARAGGFGVLGLAREMPDDVPEILGRMEDALSGRPYGVDLMLPSNVPDTATLEEQRQLVPQQHKDFVAELTHRYGLPAASKPGFFTTQVRTQALFDRQIEQVLNCNATAVATAIGIRPDLIARAKAAGKFTLSLVGSARHARKALDSGVEALVAQGYDAGGHTGPVGTFSLVPQIVAAAKGRPVLAAGGIATGGQVVASLAMGAQGAWLGTLWMAARENHTPAGLLRRLIAGDSESTVITKAHSGKPCRVIRSEWVDAWHAKDAPEPLGMPLQQSLTGDAFTAMHERDDERLIYDAAGQSVFGITEATTVGRQMQQLLSEADDALAELAALHGWSTRQS